MFNEDPGAWLQSTLSQELRPGSLNESGQLSSEGSLIPVGAYLRRGAFAKTGEVNYEGVSLNRTLNREGG